MHHMGKNIKSIVSSTDEKEMVVLKQYDQIVNAIDALHLTKEEF